jgi:16S rRNA (guanine(966)-N(2))-methyltransferase RsmD
LQPFIAHARFLDLFAGTGAMGLEALSRGAAQTTFVDNHRAALDCIHENVTKLKVEDLCAIISGDIPSVLERLQKMGRQFDVIYIDPPYHGPASSKNVLEYLDHSDLIANEGIVFVEEAAPSRLQPNEMTFVHLAYIRSKKFGDTLLHQYENPSRN